MTCMLVHRVSFVLIDVCTPKVLLNLDAMYSSPGFCTCRSLSAWRFASEDIDFPKQVLLVFQEVPRAKRVKGSCVTPNEPQLRPYPSLPGVCVEISWTCNLLAEVWTA